MSRRRGEFEHRTSIFEGAYRAWSHLGGLSAEDLETKDVSDLDPLTNPLTDDARFSGKGGDAIANPDGSKRREYPYEPLPRSGLAHPYVQAILTPWLGPEADNEAIQLGLTTLRTWWQHRRKGESGSAVAALGTEKMKGIVERYTRHFFTLSHCLVVNENVQPPRGLHGRMKVLEKIRNKRIKQKAVDLVPVGFGIGGTVDTMRSDLTNPNLTPLEQFHLAQQHQMDFAHGMNRQLMSSSGNDAMNPTPIIDLPLQALPGNIGLPSAVGSTNMQMNNSSEKGDIADLGDPNKTPVVFVSGTGDIQIAMKVGGITCSHCIKIVETVLRGSSGNRSPISGLLDAAADLNLKSVLLKIDKASHAKRIASEAKRNLSMVGYTADAIEMSIVDSTADSKVTMNLGALSTVFEVVASTDPQDVFDWTVPCTCPDNGLLSPDCNRHMQMNTRLFDAFKNREERVKEYMAGCAAKYGMVCTCGVKCRCMTCNCKAATNFRRLKLLQQVGCCGLNIGTDFTSTGTVENENDLQSSFSGPLSTDQPLDFSHFPMGPPAPIDKQVVDQITMNAHVHRPAPTPNNYSHSQGNQSFSIAERLSFSSNLRNSNRPSFRQSIRGMSITSETTFGRAMSGLSALSIDWENLDDFDVEVDHSAHINNASPNNGNGSSGPRRPSIRRSNMSNESNDQQVTFKV